LKNSSPPSSSEQQVLVAGENSKIEYSYGWYSASAEGNDMQGIITRQSCSKIGSKNASILDSQIISTNLLY
jgi:hypothetical protein